MTLEERLNDLIEEKESEIESLNEKVDRLMDQTEWQHKQWMVHSVSEPLPYAKVLPVPRLELRQRKEGYHTIFDYGMVYKHYSEMGDNLCFIPMSQTKCSGDYEKELPFRDGVHIRHDSKSFKMPGFLIDTIKQKSYPIEDCK